MLKYLFVVGITLLPFLGFSQNKFSQGYIVNQQGDTIKCLVAKVASRNTPDFVEYKLNKDGKIKKALVKEVNGFKEEVDKYERHLVKLSLSTSSVNELSVGIDTTFTERLVFLKVIQEGKNINLYVYNDKVKRRFFIKEREDSTIRELLTFTYYEDENKTKIVNVQSYRRQWYGLFSRYQVKNQDNTVMNSVYTQNDMLKLASLVNREGIVDGNNPKRKQLVYFAGLGVNAYKAFYDGQHLLAENAESSKKFGSHFFMGVDLLLNPRYGKSIIRTELSFYRLKNKIIRKGINHGPYDLKHLFEHSNIGVSVQFIQKFYKSKFIDVYAGFGALFQATISEKNVFEYHYPHISYNGDPSQFSKSNFFLPITAGITFGKIDINASYFTGGISKEYTDYRIKLNRLNLGVSYQFNRR